MYDRLPTLLFPGCDPPDSFSFEINQKCIFQHAIIHITIGIIILNTVLVGGYDRGLKYKPSRCT